MSQSHHATETDASDSLPNGSLTDAEESSTEGDQSEPIGKDDLFHLLQNERRRAVIRYLEGREQSVKMRDVAEQVAAWEHDTTVQALTSDQRQRVYIALYQSHLDTLDDAGVIDYNKSRGIVDPQPPLDQVADYVNQQPDDEADDDQPVTVWEQGYLSLSLVGSLLLVGTALNITPFQLLSGFVAGVIIITMFSLLTVAKLTLVSGDEH